jgi:CHAD domain-containing protein
MSYRLELDEGVEETLRRVAHEQLDKALGELDDDGLGLHESVHQVRKRCKKLRALARLVRGAFDDYSDVNGALRDAARRVSDLRDAEVFVETIDEVIEPHAEVVDARALSPIREAFVGHREGLVRLHAGEEERLELLRADLLRVKDAVDDWQLDEDGYDAVAKGLAKTYGRARDAMGAAYDEPRAERFHEWRKRVKYHRYHVRLLQDLWTGPMAALRAELHRLSDLLGDAHDLSELSRAVEERLGGDDRLEGPRHVLQALIERRRAELRDLARPLGQKLFSDDPDVLVERVSAIWHAAR